jgi:DNA-binding CsgD family transcriptional regulator
MSLAPKRNQASRAPSPTIVVDHQHLAALGLTPRECEVMQWLSEGKRDREIAIILGLSSRTVEKHIGHIFEKLGVETRTAATSECRYSVALSARSEPVIAQRTSRAARDGLPSQPIYLPEQSIPKNRRS